MEEKSKNILKTAVTFAFVAMLVVLAFNRRTVQGEKYWLDLMGTGTHIIVIAKNEKHAQRCIESAREQLQRIDQLMDYHDPNSRLSEINKAAFYKPVKIEKDLFDVINIAIEYSRMSNGEFDVTIGPLEEMWRDANNIPSEKEIASAKAKVGYQNIILNHEDYTIKFKVEGMKIDLGSIAKGYAIDEAVKALQQCDARGGLVDIGGDIRCFGKAAAGKDYIIGLQNPDAVEDVNVPQILMKLAVSDMAVATSGDYRRYVQINGERISHIIDPVTEKGAGIYSSVTVISPKAIHADAMATMLSLLPPEKAIEIVEKTEDTEAILITKDKNILKSSGADGFIK